WPAAGIEPSTTTTTPATAVPMRPAFSGEHRRFMRYDKTFIAQAEGASNRLISYVDNAGWGCYLPTLINNLGALVGARGSVGSRRSLLVCEQRGSAWPAANAI